jgi:alpha-ketoglutaric semialdehyde dehydrogenase
MTVQPVLLNGAWCPSRNPVGTFTAENPALREALSEIYPVSGIEDVELALTAAREAVAELRSLPPETLAHFLEVFAAELEARRDALVETAQAETGLPATPRLAEVEFPRTTNQLRQAAAAARDRSWCRATIDTAANIRSKYGPLGGPVAVFGPNNFPFAFNSAGGGDFAAAIAAGNPVIAKANTSHPGTSRIFADAALEAIRQSYMPAALVQMIYRLRPQDGLRLVSHPLIGATAFTGSKTAGLKLKQAAESTGKPIYLEMSSLNPVVILPGALQERAEALARDFCASCTLGGGQFCTNPGLVLLLGDNRSAAFIRTCEQYFRKGAPQVLLGAQVPADIDAAVEMLQRHGAELITGGHLVEGGGYSYANTLLRVSGDTFLRSPGALQTEAFGPVSLIVSTRGLPQLLDIIERLEGSLTGSIYSHTRGEDDHLYDRIAPVLRLRVGRLLNDKMPTGVAVSPAMNHGGPYPATGHPGFTAVGIPASMLRFAALHCYDNVPLHRLPRELQDRNCTGSMWRLIDGRWTQESI